MFEFSHVGRVIRSAVIGILAVSSISLLVFGPRATEPIPQDRVVIEYWGVWTGYEEKGARSIVDDFNNTVGKDKGIYVRFLSISNVIQKTLIATAGGSPPDIAGLSDELIAQFAALDAIEPLEAMAADYSKQNTGNQIDSTTYKSVYWDAVHYDGHLYGLISTPENVGMLYNKRTFQDNAAALKAAGLNPDRPPRTMDQLDAYAKALDLRDEHGRIIRAGTLPLEPGWFLYYLPMWFGGHIWNEKTQKFTLTDPAVVKAFDWIQSYSRKLGSGATCHRAPKTGSSAHCVKMARLLAPLGGSSAKTSRRLLFNANPATACSTQDGHCRPSATGDRVSVSVNQRAAHVGAKDRSPPARTSAA
jgi:ABC-type glycerol-3-phosphate transport system substrate-binding protein